MLIHRRDLKHRDINPAVIVDPKERKLAEHHRDVPAASVSVHVPVVGIKMRRLETNLLIAFRRQIGFKRFFSDRHSADDRNIPQFIRALGDSFVNVYDGAAAQPKMQPVAVLNHIRGLLRGDQLLLILRT